MSNIVQSGAALGTNADPSVVTLPFTPNAGNRLIVVGRAATVVTIDGVTDNLASAGWAIDTTGDSARWAIASLPVTTPGMTSVSFNLSAASTIRAHFFEVAGLDPGAARDVYSFAASGEGTAVAHGHPYTTVGPEEFVLYGVQFNVGRTMTAVNGSTILQTSSLLQGAVGKVIAAAGAGDVEFTLDDVATSTGLGAAYAALVSGIRAPMPMPMLRIVQE
jgi:hypothetical protein